MVSLRMFVLIAVTALVSLAASGCGAYKSPLVPCSASPRSYDLTGERHGPPQLLGAARASHRSIVYAVATSGGVYSSTTHGSSWHLVGPGIEGEPCGLLALDAAQPQTMYAGNGDVLFRSTDAGAKWELKG
jgi:hypothetical protein